MRQAAALLLAVLLLPPFSSASSAPAPVEARGPDEDGAFVLVYDVTRAEAGNASLRLLVERDDAGDVVQAERDVGPRTLPAGASRLELPFLPAEGPGAYAVALWMDGVKGAPLRFDVNGTGGASAVVSWDVPDAPTYLNLTSDTVNADGKLKAPGEVLLTRARLSDANGLGDVDRLAYLAIRGDHVVEAGEVPAAWAANATSADVEHRFARSPIAAGTYALHLRAEKAGGTVAERSRTFVIKEVAPTLASLVAPEVVPDGGAPAKAEAVLADKNGWNASSVVEARVYRGSTRLDGSGGVAVSLGALAPLPDASGAARVALPIELAFPRGATPGAHRVSVLVDGAALGSATFDVRALPALTSARAERQADEVAFTVGLSAPGVVDLVLRDARGAVSTTTRDLPAGETAVRVPPPSSATALTWNVTLRARVGGPALAWAEGPLGAPGPEPVLVVTPLRAPPRSPAVWRVEADGWDLAGAVPNATLRRWDGAVVDTNATFDGARLSLAVPGGFAPGRYDVDLALRLANGTVARTSWGFEAAPWLRIELGAPVVDPDGTARIEVRNVGGAALRALVVEVDGATPRRMEGPAGASAASPKGPRHVVDLALAPGERATLVLDLPDGPLRSGKHAAQVRVLALGART